MEIVKEVSLDKKRWQLKADKELAADQVSDLTHEQRFNEEVEDLVRLTGLSKITVQICFSRGLKSKEEILQFLSPSLSRLTSPDLIKDMDVAIERLVKAKNNGHKIRIFGDYDVDGTCGAALLYWVLKESGFEKVDATQPDRFKDGYGLNVNAVKEAVADGIDLLLTVDCGITSFQAIDEANANSLDVIVIDHHQVDQVKGVPKALAVVNPQRADCESGLKQLCGCGLAFYLAIALRAKGRELNWFSDFSGMPEPNLKLHLDLVVIATAADMVPLIGDNRILVRHGMEVLKASHKPGVKALLNVSGLSSKTVSPSHLGFALGPRINASGRMAQASFALELLTTEDNEKANELALHLEKLNQERAEVQNQIWDQVRHTVQREIENDRFKSAVVVGNENWHEGVVGIVASRVTETFKKPAIIISIREGIAKGSVRSYGGKNVLSALRQCEDLLLGYGGHHFAAGLSLSPENLDAFALRFDEEVSKLTETHDTRVLWIESDVSFEDLDFKALYELENLAPFGPGNPEPLFRVSAEIRHAAAIKDRHLRLSLFAQGKPMQGIWFGALERFELSNFKGVCSFVGVPELNRFRGNVTPSFRIRDCKINLDQ